MLVLSRKTRQQIRIGDDITVTILVVKGQVVRVGIEAPRDVRVLRAELPVFDEPVVPEPKSQRSAAPGKKKIVTTIDTAESSADGVTEAPVRRAACVPTRRRARPPVCSNCGAAAAWRG